jgi:hypothetical protein
MLPRPTAAPRTGLIAVTISAAAVITKIALLCTSQRALDGDEAILGLMATHISQGKSHPLFFYGQSYDAGAGILAHIAALIFSLVGISGLGLKAVALGVWLAAVLMATLAVRRCFGWTAASMAAALLFWAPSSVEWAMKARGGHVLAALFIMVMLYLALSDCQTLGRGAIIGVLGAAAIWCQPGVFPAAAVIAIWIGVESLTRRQFLGAGAPVLGAVVISILPLALARGSTSSWSWETLAAGHASRNLAVIFGSMVPGIFTPELDGVFPPAPRWINAIGFLWLLCAAAAMIALLIAIVRGTITGQVRRSAALLVAVTCAAPLATLMVDSDYARPRHMLVFYPLACMVVAAGIEVWRERLAGMAPVLISGVLVLSGVAVHCAYLGPRVIHGAGEQEAGLPAEIVDRAIADLDAHQVRCVFSESPMLQWNLMFDSRERIAARWTSPNDRWQPYVERVNAAFAAGQPCALLMRNVPYHEPIPQLRARFTGQPQQFTAFNDSYALLYNPPRQYIAEHFPVEK